MGEHCILPWCTWVSMKSGMESQRESGVEMRFSDRRDHSWRKDSNIASSDPTGFCCVKVVPGLRLWVVWNQIWSSLIISALRTTPGPTKGKVGSRDTDESTVTEPSSTTSRTPHDFCSSKTSTGTCGPGSRTAWNWFGTSNPQLVIKGFDFGSKIHQDGNDCSRCVGMHDTVRTPPPWKPRAK